MNVDALGESDTRPAVAPPGILPRITPPRPQGEIMNVKPFVFLAAFVLAVPLVSAQGKGGGGQGRPQGEGQGQGQGQAQGQQGQQGRGSEMGKGTMQRDRIRATDQQRDQIRTCDQSMDRVRTRARDMAQASAGKNFNADQARQQRNQLRNEVQTMEQEHARLMQGMSGEQREAFQSQIRSMEQNRERIHTRLQEMEQELAGAGPNGNRVAEQARAVEREMKEWQKANRKMATEMAARP